MIPGLNCRARLPVKQCFSHCVITIGEHIFPLVLKFSQPWGNMRGKRKQLPQITVPKAKLQTNRATVPTQPSQLRPSRLMGNKAREPIDSLMMSAIPRLTPQPPMGRLHMQLLLDSLLLVILHQLHTRHTASLFKDMALMLMTPTMIHSPKHRPFTQICLHMSPRLPAQPKRGS